MFDVFKNLLNPLLYMFLFIAAGFVLLCAAVFAVPSAFGSQYRVLDTLVTLLGLLTPILTLFAFIEYTWLQLVGGVLITAAAAFGIALEEARAAGVMVLHLPCRVTPNSLEIIAKNIFASTQPTERSFGL